MGGCCGDEDQKAIKTQRILYDLPEIEKDSTGAIRFAINEQMFYS